MRPAEEPRAAAPADGAAYAQPTPRLLYVHDDLSDEVGHRLGPGSAAAALTRSLFELLRRDQDRVIVLTLAEQLDRVIAHGSHAPFDLALGVGRAGEQVSITSLGELDPAGVDMNTLLIVGSSTTRISAQHGHGFVFTPRHYTPGTAPRAREAALRASGTAPVPEPSAPAPEPGRAPS